MILEDVHKNKLSTPFSILDSLSGSNAHKKIDKQLEKLCIEEFRVVESKDDQKKKENALMKMNEILKTWMHKVNTQLDQGLEYENSYARLLCFGSYKLGVSTPSGDIDAIVLSPNYVHRDRDFFGTLYQMLEEYSKYNKNINQLTKVNAVHSITPLIKLEFYGVEMDLLFANLDNVS